MSVCVELIVVRREHYRGMWATGRKMWQQTGIEADQRRSAGPAEPPSFPQVLQFPSCNYSDFWGVNLKSLYCTHVHTRTRPHSSVSILKGFFAYSSSPVNGPNRAWALSRFPQFPFPFATATPTMCDTGVLCQSPNAELASGRWRRKRCKRAVSGSGHWNRFCVTSDRRRGKP